MKSISLQQIKINFLKRSVHFLKFWLYVVDRYKTTIYPNYSRILHEEDMLSSSSN